MKTNKTLLLSIAFLIVSLMLFSTWETVTAQTQTLTATKTMEEEKSVYMPFGRGGIYIPKAVNNGYVQLTRTWGADTKKIAFTQPWLQVKLFNQNNKEITTVKSSAYLFFSLNEEERAAWDKGLLSIYQYNVEKKTWDICKTYFIGGISSTSYGRVIFQISNTYGIYALGIKK